MVHQGLSLSPEPASQGVAAVPRAMRWPALWAFAGLLCLCPAQALGQERGACPGEGDLLRNTNAHTCTCGSRKWDALEG